MNSRRNLFDCVALLGLEIELNIIRFKVDLIGVTYMHIVLCNAMLCFTVCLFLFSFYLILLRLLLVLF